MGTERTPLIAGNWKMHLDHLQSIAFVQKLAWNLKDAGHRFTDVEVAIFPPFTDIRSLQTLIQADKLLLTYGAQDLSAHDFGAYTGEISGQFLSKLDCKYVIVGHSERRLMHGETDEDVTKKTLAALKNGLIPLICVGETAEDREKFGPSGVPVSQLSAVLSQIDDSADIVVAYEPVWAIGSGQAATAEQAENVSAELRRVVQEKCGAQRAEATRILYGGSVKAQNISGFMQQPNVDGALVGGASLDLDEFSSIVRYQKHYAS